METREAAWSRQLWGNIIYPRHLVLRLAHDKTQGKGTFLGTTNSPPSSDIGSLRIHNWWLFDVSFLLHSQISSVFFFEAKADEETTQAESLFI